MKTKDKVIVVTGAGSGMGRQLAIQLVKKGAKVAMVDIHESQLHETEALAGKNNVSCHILDVTNKSAVELLPEQVIQIHGNVDAIINNAGIIQPFVDIKELDYKTIEKVMNVNFYGTLYMIKAFLPHLLNRPEAHIMNVSSMGGFIPFPGQSVYSASKAAVKILTEGLYSELKGTTVRVTVVHPGAINTNIMSNSGLNAEKELPKDMESSAMPMLSSEKAAEIMIDAMKKNKFRVLVGKDASFLDKLYRFSPQKAVDFIVKQMSKMKK